MRNAIALPDLRQVVFISVALTRTTVITILARVIVFLSGAGSSPIYTCCALTSLITKHHVVSTFIRHRIYRHELIVTLAVILNNLELHSVFIKVVSLDHEILIVTQELRHGLLLGRWSFVSVMTCTLLALGRRMTVH